MKKNNKNKKAWMQYIVIAVVAIALYTTGLHTEVIGFAQRGLLATGLMNPDIPEIVQLENESNIRVASGVRKAKFNFDLIDRNGKQVSLQEMKGKVIFMNFWATWCPPCIAEMPSIDKLEEEMGDDVEFVMISLDNDFQKAIDYDQRKEYNLPIYAPADGLPSMYQSAAIPTTFIIDADGNLVLTHKGMADYGNAEFKEFLENLK